MPVNVAVEKKGLHLRMCNVVFSSNGGISSGGLYSSLQKACHYKKIKKPLPLKNAVEDIFPHFAS